MSDLSYLRYFSEVLEVEPTIQNGLSILDHDVVFWMGDLNYRLDDSVETEECFAKIEANDWDFLRKYDQLNMERARGKVFVGFQVREGLAMCGGSRHVGGRPGRQGVPSASDVVSSA